MDPSMDLLTDLQAGTAHLILHIILDQLTETTVTQAAMTHTTDKDTTGKTIETEDTNITQDTNRETKTTRTGLITIKIETCKHVNHQTTDMTCSVRISKISIC